MPRGNLGGYLRMGAAELDRLDDGGLSRAYDYTVGGRSVRGRRTGREVPGRGTPDEGTQVADRSAQELAGGMASRQKRKGIINAIVAYNRRKGHI